MFNRDQQSVSSERSELDAKVSELDQFMRTDEFKGLQVEERRRLGRQWWIMTEYSAILGERIAALG